MGGGFTAVETEARLTLSLPSVVKPTWKLGLLLGLWLWGHDAFLVGEAGGEENDFYRMC